MFLGHITFKHITAAVLAIVLGSGACMVAAASSTHNDPDRSFLFFGKKKRKARHPLHLRSLQKQITRH